MLQWTSGLTTVVPLLVTPSLSTFYTQALWKYEIDIKREIVLALNKTLDLSLHCFRARLVHVKLRHMATFPVKIICVAHQELSPPTTSLIINSISANAFTSVMKCAEISLSPIVSKIYESVMTDQLFEYFLDKFHDFVCAFRRKYSCQSVLLKVVDDWKCALDQNIFTGVGYMDLSKAFHCLPHGLLIAKLHAYGLDGTVCELLSGASQTACQDWNREELIDGINQRGNPRLYLLGPLLFDKYIYICIILVYCIVIGITVACRIMPMTMECLILQQLQKMFCQIYALIVKLWLIVRSKRHGSQSKQIPIDDFVTECHRWHWIEIGQEYHSQLRNICHSSLRHNRLPIKD